MSGNFWSIFWSITWSFVVIGYFMLVIFVFADILRDRVMSGWGKAIWALFLILFPFPAALVYLVVRGNTMEERQRAYDRQLAERADEYLMDAMGKSPADRIGAAKKLFDDGTITEAEYARLKAKVLAEV